MEVTFSSVYIAHLVLWDSGPSNSHVDRVCAPFYGAAETQKSDHYAMVHMFTLIDLFVPSFIVPETSSDAIIWSASLELC